MFPYVRCIDYQIPGKIPLKIIEVQCGSYLEEMILKDLMMTLGEFNGFKYCIWWS